MEVTACTVVFPIENVKSYYLWEKSGAGLQKMPVRAEDFPIETKKKLFCGTKLLAICRKFLLEKKFFP